MFTPLTNNMEERLELIKNSMSKEIAKTNLNKCKSLEDFYWYAEKVKSGIIAQMQIYVLENYEKVTLEYWNKGNFKMHPHLGEKTTLRFGKEDVFKPRWKNVKQMQKHEKRRYDESIKITSIKFTLDQHDGDFSVKFNDSAWTFLWEDDILVYYFTVKNFLENSN